MKLLSISLILCFASSLFAAVPTEEGLLKNLNNAAVSGNLVTIKSMLQSNAVGEGESVKTDFYKWVFSLENPNMISMLQIQYSNGQMQAGQMRDVKFIPDIMSAIKKDKSFERAMFYAALTMVALNQSEGMESFLEKSQIAIKRNRNSMNEDKMKLLRAYRSYLSSNKGKNDANSPLNPTDPAARAKVQELFRANSFVRAKNIELVKLDKEFLWKVDWKSITGYFSNEERQLRALEFTLADNILKLEASEYTLFNGVNEFPKFFLFRDSRGENVKMQTLAHETKTNKEKKLAERFEEAKKLLPSNSNPNSFSFLY